MFINKTVFKRFAKEAYNHDHLTVGNVYEGIVVSGEYWKIYAPGGNMPNWFKAALIELIGELPDKDIVLEYRKEEAPQQRLYEDWELDLHALFMKAKNSYTVTPVLYEKGWMNYHFFQSNTDAEILGVPENLFKMVDFSNMESDEFRPAGPSTDERKSWFYWSNEHCVLGLMCIKPHNENIRAVMDAISAIDFREDE